MQTIEANPDRTTLSQTHLEAAASRLRAVVESKPDAEGDSTGLAAWEKEFARALRDAKRAKQSADFFLGVDVGDFERIVLSKPLPKDCQIQSWEKLAPAEVVERLGRFYAFLQREHIPKTQGRGKGRIHPHSEQLGNILQGGDPTKVRYIATLATMPIEVAEPLFIKAIATITDRYAPCRKLEALQLLDSTAKDFIPRYKVAYANTIVDGEHLMASWLLIKKLMPATSLMAAVTADSRCPGAKSMEALGDLVIKVEEQLDMLGLSHCGGNRERTNEMLEEEEEFVDHDAAYSGEEELEYDAAYSGEEELGHDTEYSGCQVDSDR
jgi:hypothetical protein